MPKNRTDLKKSISYSKGSITSKVVAEKPANATLFCMAAGTRMSSHSASRHGFVYVIEGGGVFSLKGRKLMMAPGAFIEFEKGAEHSLSAAKNTSFLLFLA